MQENDLFTALNSLNLEEVKKALGSGAEVNSRDQKGTPAIFLALATSNLSIFNTLINANPYLWAVDDSFHSIFDILSQQAIGDFRTAALGSLIDHWQSPKPTEVIEWAERAVSNWPDNEKEQAESINTVVSYLFATNVSNFYTTENFDKWIGHLHAYSGHATNSNTYLEYWFPEPFLVLRSRVLMELIIQSIQEKTTDYTMQRLATEISTTIEMYFMIKFIKAIARLPIVSHQNSHSLKQNLFKKLAQHIIHQCVALSPGETYSLMCGWFEHYLTLDIHVYQKGPNNTVMLGIYIDNLGTGSTLFHEKEQANGDKFHPFALTELKKEETLNNPALLNYFSNVLNVFAPATDIEFKNWFSEAWQKISSLGEIATKALRFIYDYPSASHSPLFNHVKPCSSMPSLPAKQKQTANNCTVFNLNLRFERFWGAKSASHIMAEEVKFATHCHKLLQALSNDPRLVWYKPHTISIHPHFLQSLQDAAPVLPHNLLVSLKTQQRNYVYIPRIDGKMVNPDRYIPLEIIQSNSNDPYFNLFKQTDIKKWFELKKEGKILILGHPGTGKSTFCRYLVNTYTSLWPNRFEAVLAFSFRELDHAYQAGMDLETLLGRLCFNKSLTAFEKKQLRKAWDTGCMLLVLDAADESSLSSSTELHTIRNRILNYPNQVVTSRFEGLTSILRGYNPNRHCKITGFTLEKCGAFLEKFGLDSSHEERLNLNKLKSKITSSPMFMQLGQFPLLMELLATIALNTDFSIPVSITHLYYELVAYLLRLSLEKNHGILHPAIKSNEIYCHLSAITELKLLEQLAKSGFECNETTLSSAMLTQIAKNFRSSLNGIQLHLHSPFLKPADQQAEKILSCYFGHLSFRDFFMASWLAEKLYRGKNEQLTSFMQKLGNKWSSQTVWPFVAGLLLKKNYSSIAEKNRVLENFFQPLLSNILEKQYAFQGMPILITCLEELIAANFDVSSITCLHRYVTNDLINITDIVLGSVKASALLPKAIFKSLLSSPLVFKKTKLFDSLIEMIKNKKIESKIRFLSAYAFIQIGCLKNNHSTINTPYLEFLNDLIFLIDEKLTQQNSEYAEQTVEMLISINETVSHNHHVERLLQKAVNMDMPANSTRILKNCPYIERFSEENMRIIEAIFENDHTVLSKALSLLPYLTLEEQKKFTNKVFLNINVEQNGQQQLVFDTLYEYRSLIDQPIIVLEKYFLFWSKNMNELPLSAFQLCGYYLRQFPLSERETKLESFKLLSSIKIEIFREEAGMAVGKITLINTLLTTLLASKEEDYPQFILKTLDLIQSLLLHQLSQLVPINFELLVDCIRYASNTLYVFPIAHFSFLFNSIEKDMTLDEITLKTWRTFLYSLPLPLLTAYLRNCKSTVLQQEGIVAWVRNAYTQGREIQADDHSIIISVSDELSKEERITLTSPRQQLAQACQTLHIATSTDPSIHTFSLRADTTHQPAPTSPESSSDDEGQRLKRPRN